MGSGHAARIVAVAAQACAKKELGLVKGSECAGEFRAGDRGEAWWCITKVHCQQRDRAALKSTGGTKTVAGYAQVTLVGVDLDHVTTSRYAPEAAEYGGTVTLRARSRGIDFTYTYPFSNRTSVLDAMYKIGAIAEYGVQYGPIARSPGDASARDQTRPAVFAFRGRARLDPGLKTGPNHVAFKGDAARKLAAQLRRLVGMRIA